jgi:hypothetical protein
VHLVTGYRRGSIYKIVSRYNELGIDGLKDFRHEHPFPRDVAIRNPAGFIMERITRATAPSVGYGMVVKLRIG